MNSHPLKNWIPFRLDFLDKELHCRWLYVANKKFTEPFFHETTGQCRVFEENQKNFHAVSTLDGIIDFSENIASLAPTAFIFHISRCGSTLLAQLLSLDEQNIVLAEPPIFDEVLREIFFKKPNVSEEKIDESLKAVVKFLGQKRTGEEQNFFIKLDSWHIFYYEKLRKLYPETPFIFSLRRPDEVIRSQVQESGMHAAPGVIQPAIFGFTLEEILKVERPVYVAKVLEKYFERYLAIIEKDNNVLFINYAEGILTSLDKIEQFLKLKIEPSIKQKMVERTQFHSKRPNTVFEEKPLEDELPDYQKKVFEMYKKLTKKMINSSILNTFREHILANKTVKQKDWNAFQNAVFEHGIGMEETLHFLYFNQPDTPDFEDWIDQNKRVYQNENIEHFPDVLSQEDLGFWNKNGYIVVKNAISREDCEQTQNAILNYLEASLDNPASWYKHHEAKEGLMVLFTKHPTLEKNRASLKIQKAYQQLYGMDKIYRVIDKVSFNPPENDSYKFRGSSLHWDVSLRFPIPFKLQGLLYLTDVKQDSGAFHCVPGFHHEIKNWLKKIPQNANPRDMAIQELKPIPVLGNAGDFVIWHQALPHCATPNTSNLPRMVQYLTYLPVENGDDTGEWI